MHVHKDTRAHADLLLSCVSWVSSKTLSHSKDTRLECVRNRGRCTLEEGLGGRPRDMGQGTEKNQARPLPAVSHKDAWVRKPAG